MDRAELERLLAPYPDLLTVDEVAAVLRVHPRSVQRWARAGRFVSVRAGRTYRFPRADVLRWMLEATTWANGAQADPLDTNASNSQL
jgi:excisionase family DNA binding protein